MTATGRPAGDSPDPAPDSAGLRDAAAWLFVPGDLAATWLDKAIAAAPDVVILDLEDAVSADRKLTGRESVRAALTGREPTIPIAIRVNGPATPWWQADLEMAVAVGAPAIMLPKVGSAADVERVADALATAMRDRGEGPPGPALPALVPFIETASGVLHAEAIASAPLVAAVALGSADLGADLGVPPGDQGSWLGHARMHVTLAAAAARCGAIDAPVFDPHAVDTVRHEAEAARRLGFTGKLAIHPSQVGAIQAAFEPTEEEIRRARRVLDGFAEAASSGSGIALVDGAMVDAPIAAAASRLLARARTVRASTDR